MPICPSCGKSFSGFSFGSTAATECRDCRKAKPPVPRPARILPLPRVTLTIIGLNVAVYLAMGLSGVSWVEPKGLDAIPWGADFGPLTLSGEWWRLFTSTFVHFGIIHIGLNMWCLWNLGQALEPLMGRKIFAAMYVASGIAASMMSEAWNPWRISAGASGAIFGVAGAYVSFLMLKKTPFDRASAWKNLWSMGIFIFYNLVYGLTGATDNAAHMGGLISGLILGALIPPMHPAVLAAKRQADGITPGLAVPPISDSSPDSRENRIFGATIACSLLALCAAGFWLHDKSVFTVSYGRAVRLIRAGHPEEGARQLQDIVQREPSLLFPQVVLGQLLLQGSNPSEAVQPLESAAALDPNDVEIEHNLALAYLGAGRPADAERQIGNTFDVEKDNDNDRRASALFIRGVAEGEASNFDPAIADLRAALQLFPEWLDAKYALARFETQQFQTTRAPDDPARRSKEVAPLVIPYSRLVMASQEWPLFP